MTSGNRFEEEVSLRVFGQFGDPQRISELFNLSPAHAHRQGERRSNHTPEYPNDMWMYRPPNAGEDASIEQQLCAICDAFRSHHDSIRQLLATGQYTVNLYCSYRSSGNQGGFDLTPAALELCCGVGISLAVSIWD